MTSTRTVALAAASLVAMAAALCGCEKANDQGAPPPPTEQDLPPAVASTVPGLPSLSSPNFAPDFVTTAQDANLLTQTEAQLAQQKSTNAQVKALAASLADAHAKLSDALQKAAASVGGARLFVPDDASELAQTKLLLLGRKTGAAFDAGYLADAAQTLQVFRDAVRDYARYGDTPALRAYAAAALPGAEQRLKAAQTLQSTIRAPAAAKTSG